MPHASTAEAVGTRASLRWRLPLLASGFVVAVLAVVVAAAYPIFVAILERNAGARAQRAAAQVASIVGPGFAQTRTLLERAGPAVAAYLETPTPDGLASAQNALASVAPSPTRRVLVWNTRREVVIALPPLSGDGGQGIEPPQVPPPSGTSPLQKQGPLTFVDTTVDVRAADGAPLGTIGLRGVVTLTPPDLLQRLLGDDARVLFGNSDGSFWTDLTETVHIQGVDPSSSAVQRYRRDEGDERLGALASFGALAPWVVWVEFPRSAVVGVARSFLWAMALFTLAVAAVSVVLVRRLATRVTSPLTEITIAAEAMAAGRYDARVNSDRLDEIGRLSRAFNTMADNVARELAERQRAVDRQHATEGRYRTLFDYAPDGILIADAEGRYLDANPGICRLLGRSRDELIGRQATDIAAPEETPHIRPALETIGARNDYHREWRFLRKDGAVVEADVIATQMPDGNILAMVRDITERNRAVEAVRAAEERVRFALESAEVGIWDMDFRTHEVQWSEILEAQYGLAPGSFAGTYEAALAAVHPDDLEELQRTFEEAARRGGEFSLRHRIIRPDGSVRWINGVGQVLLGPDGTPVRGVGISLDVTSRQLLEAQFQQAQKMEAVGRLAGGVAHDFNNLLTAILGYCELVLEDLRDEDPLRLEITEIQKAGRQAADLTRQLLAFSRKQIIEPTTLDLNDVVRGLQSLLRRLISEDVDVRLALAETPMIVNADRGQIEQVVMNLAVNARDAMPTGGRLTITTDHVDLDEEYAETHFAVKPGSYVALTVTDTGVGMTPEVQSHLFEPFFTTKEAGKGTGLGLATVHGVVTRSGGSIGVYSEPGRGTSFKIYLPRVDAAAAEAPAVAPATPAHGGDRTVLVVDDAEGLRLLLSRTLTRQGFRVLLAANGQEAARQVEAHPEIEVVLTDVVMPGASGPELTLELQRTRPGLKVIYMSGYTEDAIVHHGVLKPGIAFLHKPFTAHALARKIHEVLAA